MSLNTLAASLLGLLVYAHVQRRWLEEYQSSFISGLPPSQLVPVPHHDDVPEPFQSLTIYKNFRTLPKKHPGERNIVIFVGTRPEAIKAVPLVQQLAKANGTSPRVFVTGQSPTLLTDEFLANIGLLEHIANPDWRSTSTMQAGSTLSNLHARTISLASTILEREQPSTTAVVVIGDTLTALAAAEAAYYMHIPIVHVEAGLRTWLIHKSNPEEYSRVAIAQMACVHFAPSKPSVDNLLAEGVDKDHIWLTGGSNIDLSLERAKTVKLPPHLDKLFQQEKNNDATWVLFEVHRRENLVHLPDILRALNDAASKFQDATTRTVRYLFPAHPNPHVQQALDRAGSTHFEIVQPLKMDEVTALLSSKRLAFVVTDSGGLQEEAPAFGIPTLVTRLVTTRPETIAVGASRLVGFDYANVMEEVLRMLRNDDGLRTNMSRPVFPYGEGNAGKRMTEVLVEQGLVEGLCQDPMSLRSTHARNITRRDVAF